MDRLVNLLAAGLMLAAVSAVAAEVRDPTRPPPGYGGAAPAAPPARVSSVMLRSDGRSVAIVNGEPVRVGDRLPEGRVTRIDEGGLWLATDSGPKRIGLLPAVAKKPAAKMEKR